MVFDVPAVYSSAVCVPSGMSVLILKVPSIWVIDTCAGALRRRLMLVPRLVGEPSVGGEEAGGSGAGCSIPGAVRATGRRPAPDAGAGGGEPLAAGAKLTPVPPGG